MAHLVDPVANKRVHNGFTPSEREAMHNAGLVTEGELETYLAARKKRAALGGNARFEKFAAARQEYLDSCLPLEQGLVELKRRAVDAWTPRKASKRFDGYVRIPELEEALKGMGSLKCIFPVCAGLAVKECTACSAGVCDDPVHFFESEGLCRLCSINLHV